jgi:hypothetical protein
MRARMKVPNSFRSRLQWHDDTREYHPLMHSSAARNQPLRGR